MNDKILKLNTPGRVLELTEEEAHELGAFEETALSEDEALEATEPYQESNGSDVLERSEEDGMGMVILKKTALDKDARRQAAEQDSEN